MQALKAKHEHSSVHKAIILKDYAGLRKIIAGLPPLCDPSKIDTESVSLAEEATADARAAAIDRRDVPNRDTPLHLAVKFGDENAAQMLIVAGADWSLENDQGWNALQEAIYSKEVRIAKIIVRSFQPMLWAKWCRRLPRLIGTLRRMKDFYMEISFHFESSVIPLISRIAPSDTFKIWKKGANLRADMTLAGLDGLKVRHSNQSFLFLGDGSEDGKVRPGSLCVVFHDDKKVMNVLYDAGAPATEAEVHKEVSRMSKSKLFRPGIDVTQAVLLPQTTWRSQEKMEKVGPWRTRVCDLHNVVVSFKSKRVPGAVDDNDFFSSLNNTESGLYDFLTDEERKQLKVALKKDSSDLINENGGGINAHHHSCYEQRDNPMDINGCRNGKTMQEKKGWFSSWRSKESKQEGEKKIAPSRSSLCVEKKVNERGSRCKKRSHENECKKSLRPILCLSSDFPLEIEELLPLLDILADKVKAMRRLRELLATKLPRGTFPVKVSIPIISTIWVIATFTKFEELQPVDKSSTTPSSSTAATTSSWFQWITSSYQRASSVEATGDPFAIPSDYTWITPAERRKKVMQKNKSKKAKVQK